MYSQELETQKSKSTDPKAKLSNTSVRKNHAHPGERSLNGGANAVIWINFGRQSGSLTILILPGFLSPG